MSFNFKLDKNELKLLNEVVKPFDGNITFHFKNGIIKSISSQCFKYNHFWSKTVKEKDSAVD